jgi:hypothetical protein
MSQTVCPPFACTREPMLIPVEKMTEIDELLTEQANLESLERLIGRLGTFAESEERQVTGRPHRSAHRVGWLLIVLGAASLLFASLRLAWGALVGAVLVLAGVLTIQTSKRNILSVL